MCAKQFFSFLIGATSFPTRAVNFINPAGGQWTNGYNWDPLRVPCSSDHAQIPTLNSLSSPITNATTAVNVTGPFVLVDRNVTVRSITLKRNTFIRLSGGGVFLKLSTAAAAASDYCDRTLLTPLYRIIVISVSNGQFVLSSPSNVTIISPNGLQVNDGSAVVNGSPVLQPGETYKFVINSTVSNTNFTIISVGGGGSPLVPPITMVANNSLVFTPTTSTPTDLSLVASGSTNISKSVPSASTLTVGRAIVRFAAARFQTYTSARDAFELAFRRGVRANINALFTRAFGTAPIEVDHISLNTVSNGSVIVDFTVSTTASPVTTCGLIYSLNNTASLNNDLASQNSTFFPVNGSVTVTQAPLCPTCDCSAFAAALAATTTATTATTSTTTTTAGGATVPGVTTATTSTTTTTTTTTPAPVVQTTPVVVATTAPNGGIGINDASTGGGGGGGSMIPVAAGAGGGVLVLIIVLIVVCRRKSNSNPSGGRGGKKNVDMFGDMALNPLAAGPQGWDINKNSLTMGESLGMGYYGRVRKATLPVSLCCVLLFVVCFVCVVVCVCVLLLCMCDV